MEAARPRARQLLEMPENVARGRRARTRSAASKRRGQQKLGSQPARRTGGEKEVEVELAFASAEMRPNLAIRRGQLGEEEEREEPFFRPSLIGRLESSAHFWDVEGRGRGGGWDGIGTGTRGGAHLLRPLNAGIPENYGLLLDSDLPSMEQQLAGIRQSLEQLRQFRFSQPTAEYFRQIPSIRSGFTPGVGRTSSQRPLFGGGIAGPRPQEASPSLAQIRARVLNMQFHIEHRVRELMDGKSRPISGQTGMDQRRGGWERMAANLGGSPAGEEKPSNTSNFYGPSNEPPPKWLEGEKFGIGRKKPEEKQEEREEKAERSVTKNEAPIGLGSRGQPEERQKVLPAAMEPTPVFEPIRPITFGGQEEPTNPNLLAVTERAKVDEAKAEKEPTKGDGTSAGADANFERMLQVLKNPRRFDLSSSSSSSPSPRAADAGPRQNVLLGEVGKKEEDGTSPAAPKAFIGSQSQQLFGAGRQSGGAAMDNGDSDSDFFK